MTAGHLCSSRAAQGRGQWSESTPRHTQAASEREARKPTAALTCCWRRSMGTWSGSGGHRSMEDPVRSNKAFGQLIKFSLSDPATWTKQLVLRAAQPGGCLRVGDARVTRRAAVLRGYPPPRLMAKDLPTVVPGGRSAPLTPFQ
ncbi:uncharacterized protein [Oryctolagus cuniculus]